MTLSPQNAERLVKLLVYVGGAATTLAVAWVTSKIRVFHDNRKAHHEDLKNQVLAPIRAGLVHNFGATVSQQAPLLAVQGASVEFHERAKVTEEPTEEGEVLVAPFPTHKVFGSIHSALLEDARKNHFLKLMSKIDNFLSRWGAYLGMWHAWTSEISCEILRRSGLEAYPPKPMPSSIRFYVMHQRLALFVYNRLAGFPMSRLIVEEQSSAWVLAGMSRNLAFGPREQMDALVVLLDKLLETERARAAELRSKAPAFHKEFEKICCELDYALASRRPRGRCDLVTFF